MAPPSFEIREFFHLALLGHLSSRLSGRAWAVKGGICLRFFQRSPRLSEDMDLDVVSSVRAGTLEHAVDGILEGRAFAASLASAGIARVSATKPKQTDTTQRWKIALSLGAGQPISTKLEFSRRRSKLSCSTGVPDPALLSQYRLSPFAAQFYPPEAMAAQKIAALASPSRNALRDLFDLDHLFTTLRVPSAEVSRLVARKELEAAADKAEGFSYPDFRDQVIPYLAGTLIELYRDQRQFAALKERVTGALLGMLE